MSMSRSALEELERLDQRIRELEKALRYWLPRAMPLQGHCGPQVEEHQNKWLSAKNLLDKTKEPPQ